jgi:hypothetical protein
MHKYSIIAASFVFAALCSSVSAQGLLGLGNLGSDAGGLGDVVGTVGDVVNEVTGGSVGVPGVAEVTVGPSGLSDVQVNVLGGGGESIGTGVPSILGQSPVNLALNLPDTGSLPVEIPLLPSGGNGANGSNGTNGANGTGGSNTFNIFLGSNGTNGVNGGNGGAGGNSFVSNGGGSTGLIASSSRLRMLLKILEDRDWLRLAAGNAVCLPGFGTTSINGWLNRNEMAQMQAVVQAYKRDIVTLQKMLANCRGNRSLISRNDMKRVIGVDIKDGRPVLFML